MTTPVCDFVNEYVKMDAVRMHMPGHKGRGAAHYALDITEIDGADSLYEADGILRESEKNAAELFGCPTYYSTEGSSLCIRAMLYLAVLDARRQGKTPHIAAGRNAHKTFLSAAALLDFALTWIFPEDAETYLSCPLTPAALEKIFTSAETPITAVYLTSPDYLGNTLDLRAAAEICHRHGALLLVDNAHGAYLRFLEESRHPIDLGADLACDSAHKTLSVLTGGAYLHLSPRLPQFFMDHAKNALALFGSTSPSYLILQSLDAANAMLAGDYREKLAAFSASAAELRQRLTDHGYRFYGEEPLKLTILAKEYGYSGRRLAELLGERRMICEFADPDFTVLMLTPENGADQLAALERALCEIPKREAIAEASPRFYKPARMLSVREAMFAPGETLPIRQCCGRVLASPSVGCPPAVPVVVSGERIDADALACFLYYGIDRCTVVSEN